MPQWTTAHLIFCEGPHDAALLSYLLKKELSFKQKNLKISELPYPLGHVLKKGFLTRAAEDFRLDLAKKFFLPDYVLELETTLVLVFCYGGSNRKKSMEPFLDAVFTLLSTTGFSNLEKTPDRPEYTYTIFADADARGETSARNLISSDFANIEGTAWLSATWQPIEGSKGASQATQFGPTAAYVWRKSTEDKGTLEDLVLECLDGNDNLRKTLEYLDSRFDWSPPAGATAEQVCKHAANRLKAAFCVEGQRDKPGGSLAVILGQSELISTGNLESSAAVQDCLNFLTRWLELTPAERPHVLEMAELESNGMVP